MESEPNYQAISLKQFHDILNQSNGSKIKFAVKVFLCLQYTSFFPQSIETIGAFWCKDKQHFIVNASILGDFIGIKSNSINTNFRDHSFIIVSQTRQELEKECDTLSLTETRKWKKRILTNGNFSPKQNISEIAKIPCIPPSLPLTSQVPAPVTSDFPFSQSLIQFLQKSPFQSLIIKLPYSIPQIGPINDKSSNWISKVCDYAANLWKENTSNLEDSIQNLFNFLLRKSTQNIQEYEDLEQCFINLIHPNDSFSQYEGTDVVTFEEFLHFFINYGSIDNPLETFLEITGPFQSRFRPWFNPNTDKRSTAQWLYKVYYSDDRPSEVWQLLPSKGLSKFTLLMIYHSRLIATPIYHDSIGEPDKRFFVQAEDSQLIYANNLQSILTDVLHLSFASNLDNDKDDFIKPEYVSYDFIAKREPAQITLFPSPEENSIFFSQHSQGFSNF